MFIFFPIVIFVKHLIFTARKRLIVFVSRVHVINRGRREGSLLLQPQLPLSKLPMRSGLSDKACLALVSLISIASCWSFKTNLMRLCPSEAKLANLPSAWPGYQETRGGAIGGETSSLSCSRVNSSVEHPRSRKISTTRQSCGGGGEGVSVLLDFGCLGRRGAK